MTQISIEKLQAMRDDWAGVLEGKTKTVGRLRSDLEALKAAGNKADIDPVLNFYETVLVAGKAAGRLAILDELLEVMGRPVPSVEPDAGPAPPTGGFHL